MKPHVSFRIEDVDLQNDNCPLSLSHSVYSKDQDILIYISIQRISHTSAYLEIIENSLQSYHILNKTKQKKKKEKSCGL